jgi:predicted nucleotidyltransferase
MHDPNRAQLEAAVRVLHPLLDELVFAGGCATGLLITDPAAGGIRPTMDVDVITEVASYAEYASLSERLRRLGLSEDSSEGAPTCRWRYRDLILDVMPTDERVLGFSNRWYAPAIAAAQRVTIAGLDIHVVTAVYFLATKLEAFRGRGRNDYRGSHDLEDVIAVIDGRPELLREVAEAPDDVRTYIATEARKLLGTRAFVDALSGFLLPDSASQGRVPLLIERLTNLAQSAR